MSYKNIVTKALHSYETASPITGLGIKCILDQMKSERMKVKLDDILERKLEVSDKIKTKKYRMLKKRCTKTSANIYREVATPSPFGALMEAKFISYISPEYLNHSSVYSYRIPFDNKNSFRNFEYYYENYIKMNKAVLKSLQKEKLDSVFILDLKSFYSSINISDAISQLSNKAQVFKSITHTFECFKDGVPIGLDLSHILAQAYLSSFDELMLEKFENRYFRYVDDISITCNKEDMPAIEAFIRQNLPKGISVNEEKLDFTDKVNWAGFTDNIEQRHKLNSFSTVLSIYSAVNMDTSGLNEKLRKINIYLPLFKFENKVNTSTFKRYFKLLQSEKLRLISTIYKWSQDDLVNFLINRKKSHVDEVDSTLNDIDTYLDAKDITTRFRLQNLKYHLSNLYYLLSSDELIELSARASKHQELFYFSAIVDALFKNEFKNLFELGGRYIVMFSELWDARQNKTVELDLNEFESLDHYNESLIYLHLTGVISFDIEEIKSKYEDANNYEFIVALLDRRKIYHGDDQYTKEVQMLLSIYDDNQLKELINSKFDKSEYQYEEFYALDDGQHNLS